MGRKYKILLIDDEESWCVLPIAMLKENGFDVVHEPKAENALKVIEKLSPDVVLLDVLFDNVDKGKQTFNKIKEKFPPLPVIMLTNTMKTFNTKDYPGCAFAYAKDQLNTGEEVIYKGFAASINRVITANHDHALNLGEMFDFVVGETPVMEKVCQKILQVADTDTTVLITGESGTGKELVANALHRKSLRKGKPFTIRSCGSFPDQNLLLSDLFGHDKGAFTSAVAQRKGIFETAQGGTVFFDEIGDASQKVQETLLRVIEGGVFQRVGGAKDITADTRIIAATNRNLVEDIRTGRFREDLYYRLAVFSIHMPSLRERKEDIPELLAYFILKFNKELGRNILVEMEKGKRDYLRSEVLTLLKSHNWPGNIREFKNEVRRAIIKAGDYNVLLPEHFELLVNQEENLHIDVDSIVSDVFSGKYKGKEGWKLFINSYPKTGGGLRKIMEKCIERQRNELKKDLTQDDIAELFFDKNSSKEDKQKYNMLMRKWITTELDIDWKQEKKYVPSGSR